MQQAMSFGAYVLHPAEGENEDYPALASALDEIAGQEDPRITTEFAKDRLVEAVERERTRLLIAK